MKNIIIIALFVMPLIALSAQNYRMEDLKVLQQESSFEEYFAHALDIKPSDRNSEWKLMTLDMASRFIENQLTKDHLSPNTKVSEIAQWPLLKNNEFFVEKRDQYLYSIIQRLIQNDNYETNKKLIARIFNQIHSPIIGFHIYTKILESNPQQVRIKLYPFIEKIIQMPISEFYCDKKQVQLFFRQNIILDEYAPEKLSLHPDCAKEGFKQSKELLTDANSLIRSRAFRFLDHYKQLDDKDFTLKELQEFLSDKQTLKNDLLSKLKQDHKLREYLITKLDPQNGHILHLPANNFRQSLVKIKVLNNHFPELISLNAKKCLNEIKNKVHDQNCATFFKADEVLNVTPKIISKEYKLYSTEL